MKQYLKLREQVWEGEPNSTQQVGWESGVGNCIPELGVGGTLSQKGKGIQKPEPHFYRLAGALQPKGGRAAPLMNRKPQMGWNALEKGKF